MKGRITDELKQKIKDAVSILEVVGEHVVLRKAGANHTGLCPFHSERSPSFSVTESKGFYFCFGCQAKGDIFGFVQQIHGLSFIEAVEELAERAKIPLPKDVSSSSDPEASARRDAQQEKKQLSIKLNRFVAAYFHQQLSRQPHADLYLRKRGITADLVRSFYLGAAAPSWDSLAQHLVKAKAPIEIAVELGLIKPSKSDRQKDGIGYFDLFRNRAIFPILDLRGHVAGFGGRTLPPPPGSPDVSGAGPGDKGPPKYLNSAESLLFQKGKLAYGLYQAQKHVREQDETILVEGYFDVLALHAAGIQNAVAICGTSLTHDHLTAFRRLGQKVTLLLDGDKAGIAATERAMETGLEKGLVLYGATLPAGLDPDEVLFDQETGKPTRDGLERMKIILSAAKPLLDSRIEEATREAQAGPEARTHALKQIAGWLAKFSDPVGREIRMEAVQSGMGVSASLLERAMREASGGKPLPGGSSLKIESATGLSRAPARPVPAGASNPPRPRSTAPAAAGARKRAPTQQQLTPRDKVLLTAFVRGGKYAELIADAKRRLPAKVTFSDLFDYPPVRQFVTALLTEPGFFERFRGAPEMVLQGDFDSQVRSAITEALIAPQAPYEDSEVRFALDQSSKRALEHFSQQIKAAIAQAQANKDAGLEAELMKEYLDVKRKIKEFTSFYDEA